MTVDVLFAMTGDVHRNSRALRQVRALSEGGLSIRLLALEPGSVRSALPAGVEVDVVRPRLARGPRFFGSVHRLFSRAARLRPARVYHASDLYVLRAMEGAARRQGGRLTYDARELYAHVSATEGRPLVRRFWQAVEAGPIRRADAVFTVSDSIAGHLARAYGIGRPLVQRNAPVAGRVSGDGWLRRAAGAREGERLFVHLGQMRKGRGGETIIRAASGLEGAVVVFLGYGQEREPLQRLADRLRAPVRFVDPVPPERIRPTLADADAGIALLEDTCLNHRYALPNKIFDYLAAGLPVLASRLPEMGRLVEEHGVGMLVDPADPSSLGRAMRAVACDETARARWRANALAASETFDWTIASQDFVRLFRQLASGAVA